MPLVRPKGVAAPKGAVMAFAGADGVALRAALFRPKGEPRASVILSPGRTETIEKYYEVIGELLEREFVVLTHDWRGQGASQRLLKDRLAGHAGRADDFVHDYKRLLTEFGGELPRPWVALGHSMGGCLTLLAAEAGAGPMDAVVLSAPMLCLKLGMPGWLARLLAEAMVFAGRGARPVPGPVHDPLEDNFGDDSLTHDHQRYLRAKAVLQAEPSLALGKPTWGWLRFGLDATRRVRRPENLARVMAPVLIVAAGEDAICDSSVAEHVAKALPNGTCVEVPGAFHEVLMEIDEHRQAFWKAFDAFVAPLISPSAAAPSGPRRGRRGPPR